MKDYLTHLKKLNQTLKLSEIAKAAGISERQIHRIIKQQAKPSLQTINKILKVKEGE